MIRKSVYVIICILYLLVLGYSLLYQFKNTARLMNIKSEDQNKSIKAANFENDNQAEIFENNNQADNFEKEKSEEDNLRYEILKRNLTEIFKNDILSNKQERINENSDLPLFLFKNE